MSKLLKPVFLLIGAALFVWVLREVDLSAVGALVLQAGWGFPLVILAYGGVLWADTLSWKFAFKVEESTALKIWDLFRIRSLGESFNAITPLGTMGGEPVKAQLLKDHHNLTYKQGLASQVVGRTTLLVALIAFLVPGSILLGLEGSVSEKFQTASMTGLMVFSTLILLFLIFQVTGTLGKIATGLSSLVGQSEPQGFFQQLVALDQMMSSYYKNHPGQFVKSIAWGFGGWLIGILELGITLYFLGQWMDFSQLWIVEALIQLVRVCSFFIPMSLGAQEGGLLIIFEALGMSGDVGLAVSLIRRVRELVWVAIGLIFGWGMAFKRGKN